MNGKTLSLTSLVISIIVLAVFAYSRFLVEREAVIVSTNDIHSRIDNIPRLATVLQRCRDTVETIYVDAGDRWTGDVYVDRSEGRKPILRLLNSLGCTAAGFGNHEFDNGAGFLQIAVNFSSFKTLCCNLESGSDDLSDIAPSTVIALSNGLKFFISGAVTNFCDGHPDGKSVNFTDLTFPDPIKKAHEVARKGRKYDMSILLSHMGDDHDMEYARQYDDYDEIISGHTHVRVDTIINGTRIVQSGKGLKCCGVTRVRFRGHRLIGLSHEIIDLSEVPEVDSFATMVRQIKSDPIFVQEVGSMKHGLDFDGVANLTLESARKKTRSEIAFYHVGGIRMSSLPEGKVTYGDICNIDPFMSHMTIFDMTPAEMRNIIIRKYNDTKNPKESHRIDLVSTIPYRIVVNGNDEAVDVRFAGLREGRKYRTAFSSYIVETYEGFMGLEPREQSRDVVDMILSYLKDVPSADVSNECRQSIVRQ